MTNSLNNLDDTHWHALEPASKNLMLAFGVLPFLIPIIPIGVLTLVLIPAWWGLLIFIPAMTLLTWLGFTVAINRWLFTRWRLDEDGFRLRKGHWWQKEVFIPRTRVQHLDIHHGPMERSRGLATLVIHTAGTQSHALKQGGFSFENATMLRNALIPETRRDDNAL
ncbi:MAG: PH domain-containing protein [Arenimonas sp.]|nr:PH domain-containing protein [Arenimonas sp.]